MGCGCGGSGASAARREYVATLPDGTKKTYRTEIEAQAALARAGGGTYRMQTVAPK